MMWGRVVTEVERYAWLDRPPDVLVIHAGGNDLGVHTVRDILASVKSDLIYIHTFFPNTLLLWSDMVARTTWRMARSVERLNKARIRINKVVGRFLVKQGGLVIRHRELEINVGLYLRRDGVHLTDVGIYLWTMGLQEGIQRALSVWRGP